jgi:uncharacterized membrane protein YcaP (DUF421 family)
MLSERVTEDEVRTAVRASGYASMQEVGAVVLETDASFTVLHRLGETSPSGNVTFHASRMQGQRELNGICRGVLSLSDAATEQRIRYR